MHRLLQILLSPFSILYLTITAIRNGLFNWGILKEHTFDIPLISIGNLTVGGTGKTPHTEYIIRIFKDQKKVSTLSRGYGRKTKGFIEVTPNDIVQNSGDEPLQMKRKFNDIHVNVCEDRVKGINRIIKEQNPEVVILDDAYQHRYVKPSVSVLLCDYNRPFYNDYLMPAGRLREHWSGRKRADIIIVSKCPADLSNEKANQIKAKIRLFAHQTIYFSCYHYGTPVSLSGHQYTKDEPVHVVTGIANPNPLLAHVSKNHQISSHLNFPDHHNFTQKDIQRIENSTHTNPVFTTEKDAVRLIEHIRNKEVLNHIYYIPIIVQILFKEEVKFLENINSTTE